jgi:hypothetical protein
LLKQIQQAFTVVEEVFTEAQADFMEAQLHTVRRLLTRRCGPAVSHPFMRRPGERTAVDQFTRGNATRRSECVRHHRPRTGGLTFIRVEVRSRVRVHSRPQPCGKGIALRHSRITEIKRPQTSGISGIPEASSGMETIFGMQTNFEMETIISVVIGKNTFSRSAQGIGIATGTITAIIGGMATNAASLMARG